MLLARVIGTATSTVKHASLSGWRLLVVQPCLADGVSPDGDPILAVDDRGARRGDLAIISSDGRSTREMIGSETTPVRWCVLGIKDS